MFTIAAEVWKSFRIDTEVCLQRENIRSHLSGVLDKQAVEPEE